MGSDSSIMDFCLNDLLAKYHEQGAPLYTYPQGSMGPKEADEFCKLDKEVI